MGYKPTLVMFDVDGTLVQSIDIDSLLYTQAIYEVLQIRFDCNWGRYRNVTDGGILEQLMVENEVEGNRAILARKVEERFCNSLVSEFKSQTVRVNEVPGARAIVERLHSRDDVVVAIATGGWREAARVKLNAVGIDLERFFSATGSDSVRRTEIMQIAEERAHSKCVTKRKIYFGDGEWDQTACRYLSYEFVAVGNDAAHENKITNFQPVEHVIERLAL